VQKVRNKPYNMLFTIQRLADVRAKLRSQCKKQYVGGSARVARQPNAVTRSRCGSSESLLENRVSYSN